MNVKHPGLLTYPTIYAAIELQADDLLLALTKDSQGGRYLIVRARYTEQKMTAELVEFGKQGSLYNWFPDSRLPGWVRAKLQK